MATQCRSFASTQSPGGLCPRQRVSRSMVDEVLDMIHRAGWLTHRLILVVGRTGSGKTTLLRAVAARTGYPHVAVGLELSQALLEIPPSERPGSVSRILQDRLHDAGTVVLLDNLDVLFEPSLRVDPLGLLENASRERTIVAAWSGSIVGDSLTYAEPGWPEHRVYPRGQRTVVELS